LESLIWFPKIRIHDPMAMVPYNET